MNVVPFRVNVVDRDSTKGLKGDTSGDEVRSRPRGHKLGSDFTDSSVSRPSGFSPTETYTGLIFTVGRESGPSPFYRRLKRVQKGSIVEVRRML